MSPSIPDSRVDLERDGNTGNDEYTTFRSATSVAGSWSLRPLRILYGDGTSAILVSRRSAFDLGYRPLRTETHGLRFFKTEEKKADTLTFSGGLQ